MTNGELLAHTAFAAIVIAAYTTLTVLGHDGNSLLGVLAGQGVGSAFRGRR
jgi:hypothetical protein